MRRNFASSLFTIFLLAFFVALPLTGCDSDDDADLSGDLSWEVEATAGTSVFVFPSTWDGNTFSGDGNTQSIPESGELTGNIPSGDYEGISLQVSVMGGNPEFLVARLYSDGQLLGETDSPNEDGVYVVEVGDMPGEDDFDFLREEMERNAE